MSSNLLLQRGTALSADCIFNSLRQDLIRRLTNTSTMEPMATRIGIIEKFIQYLVNSGHSFVYIRAIVLQALTKFKYMLYRNSINPANKLYMPLHRSNEFKADLRKLQKYLNFATWYKDVNIGDQFSKLWKGSIRRKGDIDKLRGKKRTAVNTDLKNNINNRNKSLSDMEQESMLTNKGDINWDLDLQLGTTTTTFFVPPSPGSMLCNRMVQIEEQCREDISWKCKIMEQPGTPLWLSFLKKTPMMGGCAIGLHCKLCDDKGVKCSKKNVEYKAECQE